MVDVLISGCWQDIPEEISSSQLEMPLYMTDCWSWLQKWKLKSFSEKFMLWFDRNHTVSESENIQKHSAVENRPEGGREREGHPGKGGGASQVCFSAQWKDKLHQSPSGGQSFTRELSNLALFLLLCLTQSLPSISAPSLALCVSHLEYLHGAMQCGGKQPGGRFPTPLL